MPSSMEYIDTLSASLDGCVKVKLYKAWHVTFRVTYPPKIGPGCTLGFGHDDGPCENGCIALVAGGPDFNRKSFTSQGPDEGRFPVIILTFLANLGIKDFQLE